MSKILTVRDYRKTALRAYFLQSAFNYGNYEGTGYAYIMYPALRKLYQEDEQLKEALQDNMEFFCTNPNFTPIITSLHLVMLENGTPPEEIKSIKRALMGPLAGIGDSLVQFCLAPLFSTIGASLARDGMILGPVFFLLAQNCCLVSLKLLSGSWGYRLGTSIVESLHSKMEQVSDVAGMIGVTVIAGLTVNFVKITTPLAYTASLSGGEVSSVYIQNMLDAVAPNLLPVLYTGLIFYLIKVRKWNVYRLVGLTVAAGIALSALGIIG
ncbi:PTS N-acetylgalactosamine transporter subunit IID [Clostridium sp. MCC353]|nr:PTS system mannose/fructose/sorbose family transporter subunit IID [Clostridium sp. MCC353]MBT9775950.1 PTS N-acetylgalactosamine transporter subunit IID [Clostridium sp. MCC353]